MPCADEAKFGNFVDGSDCQRLTSNSIKKSLAVYKDQEPLFKRQRLDSTVICSGLELVTFLVFANTSQQQTLNINASVDVILKWSANSSPNSIPGFKPTADEYICKALLPREVFIDLFPHRTPLYTQEAFMEAAMKFVPQGIGGDGSADDQRREIAALLAHIDHGTFGLLYKEYSCHIM
ncbi:hypothetical protein MPTK1_5g02500 [Marchantia polymorpha subsp. ruderalis]|uniref:Uncharacterized protein n=2 Tax=Marchantia polymorpha TaxID=3197 RepID=A0AAF6BE75_MARPO|nr:hypothetical protein MARPO_0147s0043 [Marchantia polymorpha]BBN10309.1 hypothetical protein Mp_5g02500 [Marchantia polymorpha subsp. ruderalis]PTQ29169.1 hypothetical protein MARPO_0147s0043 [Marchantia polymorpha]PTQ29170.1 hypothetical protein MARPO_0147s0043 [Marchantia polymorpha]BBN10310.1 hypothetical protein Mp_5g02500 [Marchantia polymorpha subsp. ruderalis]|eukprot:PTQ29168.1 hypothetical protein MARPO_0147s0043 [Marchantia polymorpha]